MGYCNLSPTSQTLLTMVLEQFWLSRLVHTIGLSFNFSNTRVLSQALRYYQTYKKYVNNFLATVPISIPWVSGMHPGWDTRRTFCHHLTWKTGDRHFQVLYLFICETLTCFLISDDIRTNSLFAMVRTGIHYGIALSLMLIFRYPSNNFQVPICKCLRILVLTPDD